MGAVSRKRAHSAQLIGKHYPFLSALTNLRFCSGVTRPKTVYRITASFIAASFVRVVASIGRNELSTDKERAVLLTVATVEAMDHE